MLNRIRKPVYFYMLAFLVSVIIVISCGSGSIEKLGDFESDIADAQDRLEFQIYSCMENPEGEKCNSIKKPSESSSSIKGGEEESSSSEEVEVSSSSVGIIDNSSSSEVNLLSSSSRISSSSATGGISSSSSSIGTGGSSSSAGGSSGSNVSSLECTGAASLNITAGAAITGRPIVICNNIRVEASDVAWTSTPSLINWNSPVAGEYEIFAKPTIGDCSNETAKSCGTLTVRAVSSSSRSSSSSVAVVGSSSSRRGSSSSVSGGSSSSGSITCPITPAALAALTGTPKTFDLNKDDDNKYPQNLEAGVYTITYNNYSWNTEGKDALLCVTDVGGKICDGVGVWEWTNQYYSLTVGSADPQMIHKTTADNNYTTTITNRTPAKVVITAPIKCEYGWTW